MKTFTKIILASTAGVALVGAAAVAIAHDGQRGYGKGNGQYGMMMGGGPRRMAQLDTDNDDKISLDEYVEMQIKIHGENVVT